MASKQYVWNVKASLFTSGCDANLSAAEMRFVQRCWEATMRSDTCARWLIVDRAIDALEIVATKARRPN